MAPQTLQEADEGIAAFPLALPVEPVQASPSDPAHEVTARLGEDCERLGRVAFETLHDGSDHRLSGSDLQQMSRWAAMARLLSGRVLLRIAEDHQDAAVASALKETAGALRGSAQAWQQAAAAWHRVVDLADPRAHPRLPPPSYEIVRQGKVVRLPRITPHPGAVVSHTAVVRVGQLLFGAPWQPEERPGEPRSPTHPSARGPSTRSRRRDQPLKASGAVHRKAAEQRRTGPYSADWPTKRGAGAGRRGHRRSSTCDHGAFVEGPGRGAPPCDARGNAL
ncbi:hypothetical protein [Streptomyces sp. NPDC057557]|uniref:hypothetical protein n=1 Tax=Streptomyces sp. NPDC057557 TaxID=3346167 RepID=UPI0036C1355F